MSFLSADALIVSNMNRTINQRPDSGKSLSRADKIAGAHSNSGEITARARTESERQGIRKSMHNVQNSISYLQAQQGSMETIAKILSRAGELKVSYLSPTASNSDKLNLDKEFAEIQNQLKAIQEQKFNGVSLFALPPTQVIIGSSGNELSSKIDDGTVEIKRTGIFNNLTGVATLPAESFDIDASGSNEAYVESISLKGPSGTLSWWQWPIGVPDLFTAYHGSTKIHEKAWGSPGRAGVGRLTMSDGAVHDVVANTNGGSLGKSTPNATSHNVDQIEFGKGADAGNLSLGMRLIVNEGDAQSGTQWNMKYAIEYDPIPISLVSESEIYSLDNFTLSEFEGFVNVVTNAMAENGSSYNSLKTMHERLEASYAELEKHEASLNEPDIAKTSTDMKKSDLLLNLNVNFIKRAMEIENVLPEDFLQIDSSL